MDIPFMPAIQAEEPVTHYLLRLAPHAGADCRRSILQTKNGLHTERPSWILPKNLDRIAEVLGDGWRGEVLKRKHSLAPLFHAFLDHEAADGLKSLLRTGETASSFSPRMLFMHGRPLWGVAYCLQCVKDNEESAGTPIVERTHLLLSLSVCHRHREPLLEPCRACAWRHRNSTLLFSTLKTCLCGQSLRARSEGLDDSEREKDFKLGQVARALLENDMERPIGKELAVRMQKKAAALGLLRFKDRARLLREFMRDTWGPHFVSRHGIHIPDRSSIYRQLQIAAPVRNPMTGVALVLALLGEGLNLGAQEDAVTDEARLSSSSEKGAAAGEAEADKNSFVQMGGRRFSVSEFKNHCRNILAEKMQRFPGASRSAVLERLPQQVQKWLRVCDAEYLNGTLPRAYDSNRGSVRSAARWRDFDASLAKHMRQQHQALSSAQHDRPFRIAATLLVAGHPRAKNLRWKDDPIPQARAARLELEETPPQFRQRVLCRMWVLSGRFGSASEAMEQIRPLSDDEVMRALRNQGLRKAAPELTRTR
ncbi:TniQ family protein [Ralstonia pseudosolanacearum]|uniref:TniQ family protein n=1 Tax=Ralstonia pseudosolanacearum TaxID=1310165 RepID=UPI001FF99A81|nr:TniQ family protein [Ralstonia pseudosolanacearum]